MSPEYPAPPPWLLLMTSALALVILLMAVAETTLWTHFLIDEGEYLSLLGLAFACLVGGYLYLKKRLRVSLPLMLPWLLYPVLTQGDQIIDNLTIIQMRIVTHAILAVLFATPVAVLVLSAYYFLGNAETEPLRLRWWTALLPGLRLIEEGRIREGVYLTTLALLVLEICIAQLYLGSIMVFTVATMALAVLLASSRSRTTTFRSAHRLSWISGELAALAALCIGAVLSLGLYLMYKNLPGAYQGSPHYYFNPEGQDSAYPLHGVTMSSESPVAPGRAIGAEVRDILEGYAEILQELSQAYYSLDRNYNYAFHNVLFVRNTEIEPQFRTKALHRIERARQRGKAVALRANATVQKLPKEGALASFLEEVNGYVAFSLRRATLLEQMTAEFQRTKAGLQHSTHLYEGEGKMLGSVLGDILEKHRRTVKSPELHEILEPFDQACRDIQQLYANRIVGF